MKKAKAMRIGTWDKMIITSQVGAGHKVKNVLGCIWCGERPPDFILEVMPLASHFYFSKGVGQPVYERYIHKKCSPVERV